jgi:hypothetical protein
MWFGDPNILPRAGISNDHLKEGKIIDQWSTLMEHGSGGRRSY